MGRGKRRARPLRGCGGEGAAAMQHIQRTNAPREGDRERAASFLACCPVACLCFTQNEERGASKTDQHTLGGGMRAEAKILNTEGD